MLDRLRPIAIFAKTIELGSFRRAAEALGLSPSVVSHHITQLESHIGAALIYRSTRQLSLTQEGALLYEAARRMTTAAETALEAVAGQTGQPMGDLRVTLPAIFSQSAMMEDIGAFAVAYPKIVLNLTFSDMRDDIIGGGFDVGVRLGTGPIEDTSLKIRRLFDVETRIVASPAYLQTRTAPAKPADLESWDWLKLASLSNTVRFSAEGRRDTEISFHPRLVSDSAATLYRLSKQGLGIHVSLEFVVRDDLLNGSLVAVLPDWHPTPVTIFLVSPPNAARESVTAYFLDFIQARFRSLSNAT